MGWTSQFFTTIIIEGNTPGTGIFIYTPSPGPGTLIGSWAAVAGTDAFGNSYPAGINVNQGLLQGVLIQNSEIDATLLVNCILQTPQIANPSISGGAIIETTITFDSSGGRLLAYTSSTTVVTQTVSGQYSIVFPAGVNSARVQCWGADGGGDGGNTVQGGVGAGAGEYAEEPTYPVTAGLTYTYNVGNGGTPGITGSAGTNGESSDFDGGGVFADGGQGGGGVGGQGGNSSINTIHFKGGNGGGDGTQSSGGCGGGGRAGSLGPGGNGAKSTSSAGGVGGTGGAGTGSHTGGSGGAAAANGAVSGGGAGTGNAVSNFTKTYHLTGDRSYFGSDASSSAPPNGTRFVNSSMYQGGETASGGSFNGTQKSMGLWPFTTIQNDLAGATIDSVTLRLKNLHSWYNSGMTALLGYTNNSSLPSSYSGTPTALVNSHINEGATKTITLPNSYGNALRDGTAKTFTLGQGPAFSLPYYGYFYGQGGDNNQNPMLTIKAHTGAGNTTAGAGSDGQITITYASSSVLGFAIAPVAGTDASGNAFAAGATGQIQAFQPASSPTLVETWHAMGAFNVNFSHGTPAPAYKLNADNTVSLAGLVSVVAGTTTGTFITLPVGYRPLTTKKWPLPISGGTPAGTANVQLTIDSSGNLILSAGPTSAGAYTFALDTVRFPLDY